MFWERSIEKEGSLRRISLVVTPNVTELVFEFVNYDIAEIIVES